MKKSDGVKFLLINSGVAKHSYNDFGVILVEQNISMPDAKTYTVDIEGMDGSLDLSECFGDMKYQNRTIKFTFETIEKITNWQSKITTIASFLHGQKMKITVWSDANFYYVGRCTIDESSSSSSLGTIGVSCDCEPFKYKQNQTTFNLKSGENLVQNSRMTVFADLSNRAEITINTKTFSAGTHLRAVELLSGTNTINSSGAAILTFQEGEL